MQTLTDEQLNDRFDRYGALYLLCCRWYSGGASRGYRLLSWLTRKGYSPGHGLLNNRFESEQQRDYYRRWYPLRHTL